MAGRARHFQLIITYPCEKTMAEPCLTMVVPWSDHVFQPWSDHVSQPWLTIFILIIICFINDANHLGNGILFQQDDLTMVEPEFLL